MGKIIAILFFFTSFYLLQAQTISNRIVVEDLPSCINETSGLILINGQLWSHNDSNKEPKLYCIDTTNGNILQEKTILNATNIDWEDITADEQWIYIADCGNNGSKKRDYFTIYKIHKDSLNNNDSVITCQHFIYFTYSDEIYQKNELRASQSMFDCEAILTKGDSLFLFSKNWMDNRCYIYGLPKTDNTCQTMDTLTPIDSICLDYMVTGADYYSNTIALIGYIYKPDSYILIPYISIISDFDNNLFSSGNIQTFCLNNLSYHQTEGIAFLDKQHLLISNEKINKTMMETPIVIPAKIHAISLDNHVSTTENQQNKISIFPNPTENQINVTANKKIIKIELTDHWGKMIKRQIILDKYGAINMEHLAQGVYYIKIFTEDNLITTKKILIQK